MPQTNPSVFSGRRSESERISSVESICNDYDDTLPLPCEVEQEFLKHAGDGLTALAWLADRGLDPDKIGNAALIQYWCIWNPDTGRYRVLIYGPDHVGPKYPPALAVPIVEDGVFVDLLCISDDESFTRITCRTPWLGRENLSPEVVRLHAHPMDWLAAGCTGVCHIEPISRKAFKDLRKAPTIQCNDIHTALQAWDWAFDADRACFDAQQELERFDIDDTPGNIRCYFEDEVKWRTRHIERESTQ
jgi:hypothetical protein